MVHSGEHAAADPPGAIAAQTLCYVSRQLPHFFNDRHAWCNCVFTQAFLNSMSGSASPDAQTIEKVKNFCDALATPVHGLPGGYSIRILTLLNFQDDYFPGLFLALTKGNNWVGTIWPRVGVPVEIILVQGNSNGSPRTFYNDTERHFESVLIDHAVSLVALHMHGKITGEFSGEPRLRFSFLNGTHMHITPNIRNRIADRYLPVGAIDALKSPVITNECLLVVRSSLIRRAWHNLRPGQQAHQTKVASSVLMR